MGDFGGNGNMPSVKLQNALAITNEVDASSGLYYYFFPQGGFLKNWIGSIT